MSDNKILRGILSSSWKNSKTSMFTHHEFEAVYEVLVTCYLLILNLLSNMEQYDMNQAF